MWRSYSRLQKVPNYGSLDSDSQSCKFLYCLRDIEVLQRIKKLGLFSTWLENDLKIRHFEKLLKWKFWNFAKVKILKKLEKNVSPNNFNKFWKLKWSILVRIIGFQWRSFWQDENASFSLVVRPLRCDTAARMVISGRWTHRKP